MPSDNRYPLPAWLQHRRPDRDLSSEALLGSSNAGRIIVAQSSMSRGLIVPVSSTIVRKMLNSLLPTSLRPVFTKSEPRKLHETSYLDGLRGIAALIVVFHHTTGFFYPAIRPGYGSSETSANLLLSLPLVRIWMSGGPMVSIFFVLSGYVLSTKPLRLARQGQYREAHDCVASSTFRRGPRLYIPCLTATLIIALLAQMGLTDLQAPRVYRPSETLMQQLKTWAISSSWFISPFGGAHAFEENTWTIPTEFKGSLLVFLITLGTAKSSSRFRLLFITGLALFWLYHGWADMYLFSAGMFCADVHFLHTPLPQSKTLGDVLPESEILLSPTTSERDIEIPSTKSLRTQRGRALLHALAVFTAIYLLSVPEGDEGATTSPGYITLATTLTPATWMSHFGPSRWWATLGATLLILAVDSAGPQSIYQRVLSSGFPQWLGEISFSLYLAHGVVLFSLGSRALRFFCGMLEVDMGKGAAGEDRLWYAVALLGMSAVTAPVLFGIAEVMTKTLDKKAVEIARWMSRW
jgi:peptidoglycan/LPS O-acetylase OafA/YrhL